MHAVPIEPSMRRTVLGPCRCAAHCAHGGPASQAQHRDAVGAAQGWSDTVATPARARCLGWPVDAARVYEPAGRPALLQNEAAARAARVRAAAADASRIYALRARDHAAAGKL